MFIHWKLISLKVISIGSFFILVMSKWNASLDYVINNYKPCKFPIDIYGLELYKIKSLYPSNVLHLYWRANEINEFSARILTKNVRYWDQKINDSHHMFSNIFSFNFCYKKSWIPSLLYFVPLLYFISVSLSRQRFSMKLTFASHF